MTPRSLSAHPSLHELARVWVRRCFRTLRVEDSHRESMRLDEEHEQTILRPLPHDQLVKLHGVAAKVRLIADLVGQGHGLVRAT